MTDESEFTVKLRDKVSGPARSSKRSIDDLSRSMRKADQAAARSARNAARRSRSARARTGIDGAGAEAGGGGLGIGSIVGGNLISHAIMGVGRLATGIAAAAGKFVMFNQNSALAFGQLAKHGDTSADLMRLGSNLALKFGTDVIDTTHSLQKLLAAQFNPELATDIIKMGADLRSIGATAEDTQGAIRAITQIKGAGRLMGQELLQLANAGVSIDLVRQEIGKLFGGKTNAEVMKLQEAGQIDADRAIEGILNAIMKKTGESKLGEAGEAFANNTIDGILGRFKAFSQGAGTRVVGKLIEPLTKMASAKLDKFIGFLQSPEGEKTIDKIGSGLLRAVEAADLFVTTFGGAFIDSLRSGDSVMTSMFSDAPGDIAASNEKIKEFATTMGNLAGSVVSVAKAFGEVWGFVDRLSTAVSGPLGNFGRMIGGWAAGQDNASDAALAGAGVKSRADMLKDEALATMAARAEAQGRMVAMGMAEGINAGTPAIIAAQENMGTSFLDSVIGMFQIHSPSKVMEDIGGNVAAGFTAGIDGQSALTQRSAQRMSGATLGGVARHTRGSEYRSMSAPISLDRAGGGNRITVSLHTEVHGAGGDAGETAELSARATRREIEAFFRQLGEEA